MPEIPENLTKLVAATKRLAQTDPQDAAVTKTVDEMKAEIDCLTKEVEPPAGAPGSFGAESLKDDASFVTEQISKLKAAALTPARNYARIHNILVGLHRAAEIAKRPQYAAARPRIAQITEKVAGLFAEVDTVADLDKPLDQIEKAVHGLYGDQSKNGTFYFDRRGKGHHEKSDAGETPKA